MEIETPLGLARSVVGNTRMKRSAGADDSRVVFITGGLVCLRGVGGTGGLGSEGLTLGIGDGGLGNDGLTVGIGDDGCLGGAIRRACAGGGVGFDGCG